jgi:Methylmalonic aciduria and homocystinuria type D protein
MIHQTGNKVFSEVDSAQQLLGYSVMNAGCCKVLLHPQWGSAVYPATIFARAPEEVVATKLDLLCSGALDGIIEKTMATDFPEK